MPPVTPPTPRAALTMQSTAGQALALVPLAVGLLFGALVLPRGVPPDEIPAPTIDGRALARTIGDDEARAARVASVALGSRIRAVGSAFRAFNVAEADHADVDRIASARAAIVDSLKGVMDDDLEALRDLRAFHMVGFLAEVRRYEQTGEVSDELRELGGTFVSRMETVGWSVHHRVAMPDPVRRAAFKLTWNRTVLLDSSPRFALTLDETRALYAFYFSRPRGGAVAVPGDVLGQRHAREAARKAAATWLLTKVAELSRIDPTYPGELARAAALYMKRDFRGSAAQYQTWLDAHPDGPWTLRAQNHLRAAMLAEEQVSE